MEFTFSDRTIAVNVPTHAALEREVRNRFRTRRGFALATVNLDHLAKMARDPGFARAYEGQDLVVADGRPIVTLSRIAGRPVELLPGSDLVEPLCRWAACEAVSVAMVGSTQEVLDTAAATLEADVPGLEVALKIAPSQGFDPNGEEATGILRQLEAAGIGLCFLAFGAPKQEMLVFRGRDLAPSTGFASVGAGLDFLGGGQVRAPRWMRRSGLEWLWRALGDPGRMIPRYLRCAAILPGQVAQARRLRRRAG